MRVETWTGFSCGVLATVADRRDAKSHRGSRGDDQWLGREGFVGMGETV